MQAVRQTREIIGRNRDTTHAFNGFICCEKAEIVGGDEEVSAVELGAPGVWKRTHEGDAA